MYIAESGPPYLLQIYDRGNLLDQRAVPVLGLPELSFGTLAIRDVPHGGNPDGATSVPGTLPPYLRVEGSPVFPEGDGLVRLGRAGRDMPRYRLARFGRHEIHRGHADDFRRPITEHLAKGLIDLEDPSALAQGYPLKRGV